jgi:protein-S-isoprenylcysteine O-methyltransferase Ste14
MSNRVVVPSELANSPHGAGRAVIKLAFTTILYGALLFLVAGTIHWSWGWLYLALITAVLGLYSRTLLIVHPDLAHERAHPPADAKAWDKPFVVVVGVIGPIATLLLCGLDRRLALTAPLPAAWHLAGLALVAAGGALTNRAVMHNRFFSGVVRIQRDRGHAVVDSGPYRVVRHPGYTGAMMNTIGTPLALGSLWALGLGVAVCAVFAVRTSLEDRTLRDELEGYDGYARRVRFRLVPGIW